MMAEFSPRHGAKVVSVTAKDKLRKQLQKDMDLSTGSGRSASPHSSPTAARWRRTASSDVLDFRRPAIAGHVFGGVVAVRAGRRHQAARRPPPGYPLSLAHRFHSARPCAGAPEADSSSTASSTPASAACEELGATVALTADHGMSDKGGRRRHAQRGLAAGHTRRRSSARAASTVICPITDAFVGHHGALGGFVRVYCRNGTTDARRMVIEAITGRAIKGIERVLDRRGRWPKSSNCRLVDREGDVAVIRRRAAR